MPLPPWRLPALFVALVSVTGAPFHSLLPADADPSLAEPTYANKPHLASPPLAIAPLASSASVQSASLLVFLPGTGASPFEHLLLLASAARAGQHVLGLSYQYIPMPVSKTAQWCRDNAPQDCACQGRMLAAVSTGGLSELSNVTTASSIIGRVRSALLLLHKTYPQENWSAFLTPDGGKGDGAGVRGLRWDRVVLSGHSQGAGHASWLAKHALQLDGVAPISGPQDTNSSCSWVAGNGSRTSLSRWRPFASSEEGSIVEILANWAALGLTPPSPTDVGDGLSPTRLSGHSFLSSLPPAADAPPSKRPAHQSTCVDAFTPKLAGRSKAVYASLVWPNILNPRGL